MRLALSLSACIGYGPLLATPNLHQHVPILLSQSTTLKPELDQKTRKKTAEGNAQKAEISKPSGDSQERRLDPIKQATIVWKTSKTQSQPSQQSSLLENINIGGAAYTASDVKLPHTVDGITFSADGRFSANWKSERTVSPSTTLEIRDLNIGSVAYFKPALKINSATFSPDGQRILLGGGHFFSFYQLSKTAPFLNLATPLWTTSDPKSGEIYASAFSPDGKMFVGGHANGATLRDTSTGRMLWESPQKTGIYAVAFSNDGKYFAAGGFSERVTIWDAQTHQITHQIDPPGISYSLAFSPNNNLLLIGGYHGIVIYDLAAGKRVRTLDTKRVVVNSISFFQNGVNFLIGLYDGTVLLGSTDSTTTQTVRKQGTSVLQVLSYSAGRGMAVGSTESIYKATMKGPPFQQVVEQAIIAAQKTHQALPEKLAVSQMLLELAKPVKDEFESTAQFNVRVLQWNKAAETLNKEVRDHYEKLGPLPIGHRARAIEQALEESYGIPLLQDVRYDPELARFFAVLTSSANPDFSRNVSFAIPNNQARAAKSIMESTNSGLEVSLTLTATNELLWGEAKVKLNNITYVAQYTDKDFPPPATAITNTPALQALTTPPVISTLPQVIAPRVVEDSSLAKLQTEVLRREREAAEKMAREAEEKRLRERLAQLKTVSPSSFDDDLTGLIASKPKTGSDPRLYVLAIGINDYADVPDVPFADRSAQAFAEFARKQLGAEERNVILLTNSDATLGRLRSRMRLLLSRLSPQDRLIIYYAGHGVPSRDGRAAYLLAQDGGPGSYEEPDLNLNQLYLEIEKTKVGQAMLFVDACFSGRAGRDGLIFDGIAPLTVSPKQNIKPEGKVVVLTAGRGDQFSNQLKERGHRLFSYHLMKAMLEDGAKFTASQLHSRIRERVLTDSRQLGPEFEQEPELLGNSRLSIK